MGLQFFTMRSDIDSHKFLDISEYYLKSEFLFDFFGTFPVMIVNHSRNFLILRSLHIVHLGKLQFYFKRLARKVYPNSMNVQDTFLQLVNFIVKVLLSAHYFVCLWVYIGDKYLPGAENLPWLLKNSSMFSV